MLTSTLALPRRLVQIALAAILVTTLFAAPVAAECLLDYVSCVEAASELNDFGRRSLAGLGCYAKLLSCLQRRLA